MKIIVDTGIGRANSLSCNALMCYSLIKTYSCELDKGIDIRDIAFELGVTRQTATKCVNELLSKGMVEASERPIEGLRTVEVYTIRRSN